jgi:tetratricopeptide (TPR) repeat protein
MRAARALLLGLVVLAAASRGAAEEEAPSIARALYLERTARDFEGALAEYVALGKAATDPASRAEARLGEARALVALTREADALAVWRAVADDAEAPLAARDEARRALADHQPAVPDAAAAAAEAREAEARLETAAKAEHARRVRAAERLVETARTHLAQRRYEGARDDLIRALELNPDDAGAATLLEEVGAYLEDRGDVLRQALRFVANSRLADFRHLSGDLAALADRGRRALRDGRPADAARVFRDALDRVDGSDFRADLAERRLEFAMLLRRAVDDARARGIELEEGLAVPPEGRAPATAGPSAWRSEFYALLGRVFSAHGDETAPLRFYEVAPAPSLDPRPPAVRFTSTGIAASQGPGTLRRARFVERHVRAEVAPGTWASSGRLLDRSDDTLIVQHLPDVHRRIAEVLAAFAPGPPAAVSVDVAVLGAKPGGLAEAAQILHARAGPHDRGTAHVVEGSLLEEQVRELTGSIRIALLGRATVLLGDGRRKSTSVRFSEPTANVPLYRDREGPRLVVRDGDETYGLEVEVYAEDLPGLPGRAALSAVATVRRPDRARALPQTGGIARVPVLLSQQVEADRVVPHAGSLALLGLSNPFLGTGAAGDLAGGSHPDLVVLVAVRPASTGGGPAETPDVPRETSAPPPRIVPGERVTREHDLGAIGSEIADEPPPEDWPATPASRAGPGEAATGAREAFLGGTLRERAEIPAGEAIVVREGRVTATLAPWLHGKLQAEVERLRAEEETVFEVSVVAAETRSDRVQALLAGEGVREVPVPGAASARVYALSSSAAAALDERLPRVVEASSPFAARTRLAARHTQLVTARAVSVRDIVEDFRVVRRPDGTLRALPVNGTAEDGLVATLRPLAHADGSATLHVGATLARVERVEPWRPSGGPGTAPLLDAPRHQVERAAAHLRLAPGESILLAIPSPGTGGARTVLLRASVRRLER